MFKIFKKNKAKACRFTTPVGYYYKEHISGYRNGSDTISVYRRYICDCNKHYKDVKITYKDFRPSLYEDSEPTKTSYKSYLESKGIKDELTFVMEFS